MEILKYENCLQFYEDFLSFKDYFPMVQDYLLKDDCYSNDDWIEWYTAYENDIVLAFFALRKTPLIPDFTHISVFEVNLELRGLGIGTEILTDFLSVHPNCTLFAEDKNSNFYEFLGFEKDPRKKYFYTRLEV